MAVFQKIERKSTTLENWIQTFKGKTTKVIFDAGYTKTHLLRILADSAESAVSTV